MDCHPNVLNSATAETSREATPADARLNLLNGARFPCYIHVMNAPETLVLDLLEWVAVKPRPYAEVMASWRTSCPRLPVWEDAVDFGFVQRCVAAGEAFVELTPAGMERLQARRQLARG
jgi:hypothetical protein